jgi:hypothetical protein
MKRAMPSSSEWRREKVEMLMVSATKKGISINPQVIETIGGPDRDRTDDLFHAMEARSQLRHRPTL